MPTEAQAWETGDQFIGIDLSGPVNVADTAYAWFVEKAGGLQLHKAQMGVTDEQIYDLAGDIAARDGGLFGLDAPLSYNPGGGDRPADKELRQKVVAAGLPAGSVMTPTMTRMAYLTMRGISLAHGLRGINRQNMAVLETHPGATLVFHGAPVDQVRLLKKSASAQKKLLAWLAAQGMRGVTTLGPVNDHLVAACAAAFGAWQWHRGAAVWSYAAEPPLHPFPFAC